VTNSLKDKLGNIAAILFAALLLAATTGTVVSCWKHVERVEAEITDKEKLVTTKKDNDGRTRTTETWRIRYNGEDVEVSESRYKDVRVGKRYRITTRGWKGFRTIIEMQELRDFDPARDIRVE
jgi:hypothetical protein